MPTYATPKTKLTAMLDARRDRIVQCTSANSTRAYVTAYLSDSINQYGAVPDADNMSLIGILRDLHEEKYKTADARVPGGIIRHGSRTALGRYVYGQPLPSLQSWKGDVGTISTTHGRGRQATTQGQGQRRWERVTGVTAINFSNRTAKDDDRYEWYLETRNESTGAVLTKTPVGSFTGTAGSAGIWRHHWFRNLDPSKVYYPVVEWTKGYNQIFDGADELTGTEAHGHRWVNLGRSGSKIADFASTGEDADGVGTNFSTMKFHATDERSGPDEYIITLGTNSPGSATTYADTFKVITWLRKINSQCLIWLARPGLPGATPAATWEYMIEQDFLIANHFENVGVIPFTDLYTKGGIQNWTPGNEYADLMYGPLHPNYEGYKRYAAVGFNNLTGASAPVITPDPGDGGTTPTPGDDVTGPTVRVVSPADGYVIPVGGTVDFVFEVTDPSGIGASRGIFAQPGGAIIGKGSPSSLPDLGPGYYGHRGITHAEIKALGTTRWEAVFRDASAASNPTRTLARTLTAAIDNTAPVVTPNPTITNVTPGALFEIAAGAATQPISATITHPLGIASAAVYAYGSGAAILVGPLAKVGSSNVWSADFPAGLLQTSNRFGIVAAAVPASSTEAGKTARSAEIPFVFAAGLDKTAPTIVIQAPQFGTIVGETVEFRAQVSDAESGVGIVELVLAGLDVPLLTLSRISGTAASGVWSQTIPREELRFASTSGSGLAIRSSDVAGNVRETPPFAVAYPAVVQGDPIIPSIFPGSGTWENPDVEAALAARYGGGVRIALRPDGKTPYITY